MLQYKPRNTLFRLTRLAWEAYNKDDPAYQARNPRSGSFEFRWDLNAGLTKWFFYVVLLLLAFAADLALLPFKIAQRMVASPGQRKPIAHDVEIKTARESHHQTEKKSVKPIHPQEHSQAR